MEALIAAASALIWVVIAVIAIGLTISIGIAIFVGGKMRSTLREMRGDRGRFGRRPQWS